MPNRILIYIFCVRQILVSNRTLTEQLNDQKSLIPVCTRSILITKLPENKKSLAFLVLSLAVFAGCLWGSNRPLRFLGNKHRYFNVTFLGVEKNVFSSVTLVDLME